MPRKSLGSLGKRLFAVLLLVTAPALPALAQVCGKPEVSFEPLGLMFQVFSPVAPDTCDPLIAFAFSPDFSEMAVFIFDPCYYDVEILYVGDTPSDLVDALLVVCGQNWLSANPGGEFGQGPDAFGLRRHTSAAFSPVFGQSSQSIVIADVNGDGHLDTVYVGSSGVVVQLRNAKGSVISTNQFPVGFAPQHLSSHLIAADFNGDGKLDLADRKS